MREYDILQRLKDLVGSEVPIVVADAIDDAIVEIEHLRSVAGAVSDGPSMAEIKALRAEKKLMLDAIKETTRQLDAATSNAERSRVGIHVTDDVTEEGARQFLSVNRDELAQQSACP